VAAAHLLTATLSHVSVQPCAQHSACCHCPGPLPHTHSRTPGWQYFCSTRRVQASLQAVVQHTGNSAHTQSIKACVAQPGSGLTAQQLPVFVVAGVPASGLLGTVGGIAGGGVAGGISGVGGPSSGAMPASSSSSADDITCGSRGEPASVAGSPLLAAEPAARPVLGCPGGGTSLGAAASSGMRWPLVSRVAMREALRLLLPEPIVVGCSAAALGGVLLVSKLLQAVAQINTKDNDSFMAGLSTRLVAAISSGASPAKTGFFFARRCRKTKQKAHK
jgi:hypothetical protein